MVRRQPARRGARRTRGRQPRLAARLPAPARGRRPGGRALAARVRRPRRDADRVGDLLGGARPLRLAAAGQRPRRPARRPDDHDLGHAGAEGAPPRADPVRRRDLVPGLLRARRGLGPRRAQDARGPRRRRVGRHRPEGVDERRAVLEVVHARRAHRPGRAEAQGPHLLPDGHGAGRRRGRAAAPDHRRAGVQRALHRRRADPRRQRARRRGQRLEGRADDADERARRPRLHRCRCGCASSSTS